MQNRVAKAGEPGYSFACHDVIDRPDELQQWVPRVKAAPWIAVDTEADSLHAYPEKLCLIQISIESGDTLLDPLSTVDITPLLEALGGHELIFHAADYDLRLLQAHHRFTPRAVFDTMLAARLIGHTQFGLAHLAQSLLGVKLDKAPQRANWALRPLTERMRHYALNDTRHLKPIADKLRAELKAIGRLTWHQEWCAELVRECAEGRSVDPEQVWRIKGSAVLAPHALAVLRELWQWREGEARAANRPPYFVLAHETLLKASVAAVNHEAVDALLPRGLSQRRRQGAMDALQRGLHLPRNQWPEPFKSNHRRPTEAERRRFIELERRRNKHAQQLKMDPTLIASRADLARLAHNWEAHAPDLMKWQLELLH